MSIEIVVVRDDFQGFSGSGDRKARYLIEITGFFGCGSQI
jgi:hypothetical protein